MRLARSLFLLAACAALVALLLFFWKGTAPAEIPDSPHVEIGGQTVAVTIADTPSARSRGLSGRSELSFDEGMLFVFPEDGSYAFWMKDMQIPIDILWLSNEGMVVDMALNVSPDSYPASFSPNTPARYVLEVPAGFAERYNVHIGDAVEL